MRIAPAAVLITLTLAALAPAQAWTPLTSGQAGALNSDNGDAGYLAEYFANADLSGKPAATRLETAIRAKASLPPGLVAGKAKSVRWTTAVVPTRSGPHQFALKASAGATLSVDGKAIVTVPAAGSAQRVAATVPLEAGKTYAVVIELRDPRGDATLAAEWFPPAADAPAIAPPKPTTPIAVAPRTKIGTATTLKNDAYTLAASPEGVLTLTENATGASATFAPDVSVVFQPAGKETKLDAKGTRYVDDTEVGGTNYFVPAWNKETDFLKAAQPRATLRPSAASNANDAIRWAFPPQAGYAVAATVALPEGKGEPTVTLTLTPKQSGNFSVGYVGAPAVATEAADWIWQPLVWTGKRFPNRSYLTTEYQLPIPAAMVGQNGVAIGVAADPKEMPFRMPTYPNSRFGVLLRDESGAMRPQLFAPVLGTPDSAMESGDTYTFTVRLVARKGDWYAAYKHLGQSLYAFGDQRENGVSNLNTTIDNLAALICDDRYGYWHARYKTWGYQNDGGPDAGRQQSAADALSLALVLDDRVLLETRALPTLEYMLSRKAQNTKFGEADFMGGFLRSAPSDLVAAFALTGNRSTAIRELVAPLVAATTARAGGDPIDAQKDALHDALATHRLTGDPAALAAARQAADAYIALRIAKPAANFGDVGSSFWTELAPAYDMLFELYTLTGDATYRDAAAAALREFSGIVYLVPPIPSGTITANPGGKYNNQPVPEEVVPAWRVAANGLTAECAGTAHSHRGVFMAGYASYMARLGALTNDTLMRDIARSAVVGRYANYPSYAYRNGHSTVYEKADYPLRSFEEIKKFTSAHYNHLVPMAAFLVDYLVAETAAWSGGKVDFPGEYTNTGAFFRNRVYGARPGSFYDDRGVNLWLPRGLVTAEGTIQLNTLSGYGNGRLYLAIANQSDEAVTATLAIDPKRVDLTGAHATRVWIDNVPSSPLTTTDGRLRVTVSAKGLTCVAIDGARVTTEVNGAMLDASTPALPAGTRRTVSASFGDVTATALRLGKGLTRVHLFSTARPDGVTSATLTYTVDGKTTRLALPQFPFEATVAVDDAARTFECSLEAIGIDGKTTVAPPIALRLSNDGR